MGLDLAAFVFYFVALGLMVAQRSHLARAIKSTETSRLAAPNDWTIPPWSQLKNNGKLICYYNNKCLVISKDASYHLLTLLVSHIPRIHSLYNQMCNNYCKS